MPLRTNLASKGVGKKRGYRVELKEYQGILAIWMIEKGRIPRHSHTPKESKQENMRPSGIGILTPTKKEEKREPHRRRKGIVCKKKKVGFPKEKIRIGVSSKGKEGKPDSAFSKRKERKELREQ